MATTSEATATTTVSRLLAAQIAALGVGSVFSLMGEDTAAMVTALVDEHHLDVWTMRHESAAVMAADSYAWATDGLAVCVLSHGPGFTNGMTAMTTAARAERKLLIVTGHDAHRPGMRPEMKRSPQELYATGAGLGFSLVRSAEQAADALHAAVENAVSGQPCVLSVPVDVLNSKTSVSSSPSPSTPKSPPPSAPEPSADDVEEVAALLTRAQRPLVVAGRGALHARAELVELAERTGALLGSSLLGRGLFHGHRLDLGLVGGWASDGVRPLLDELDLVVVFGASLNSFTMAFGNLFSETPIVHIDADPSHLGAHYPVALGVAGDSRATARRLLEVLGEPTAAAELHRPETLARISQPLYLGGDESIDGEADANVLATILDELLPRERTIVTDAGHFMGSPGMYMHVYEPNHFRITAAYASIGLGIGAAIGAAVARPSEQTIFFAGDGGLMMSIGDLETVARYGLPLLIVVMNDGALGAERHFLDLMGLNHEHAVFGDVDFAAVAKAFGLDSATVRSPQELRALAPALSRRRTTPMLLDCRIRGDLRGRWLDEIG